jgi:predicted HicB family RNase H-like nuclease
MFVRRVRLDLCTTLPYCAYMDSKLTVRASEEELRLWREAAWQRRVSLSEWVRVLLTANAEKVVKGNDV